MKKYIFTIAFALLGITSSMASKADTLRIYSIDGERIPNFTGKELIGKTIKNYQINTNVLPAPKRDVTEIHIITTTTPPAPKPDPHYLIKGREQELTKEEFLQDFSQQNQSHRGLERGHQSHSGKRSERGWQKLHHRYSGEITDKTYPFFFSDSILTVTSC